MRSGLNFTLWFLAGFSAGALGLMAQSKPVERAHCAIIGEVFGTDPFGHDLLLKRDDNGEIETIAFSESTRFTKGPAAGAHAKKTDAASLGIGDRLCVQYADADRKVASAILVLARVDIERRQLKVLSDLHRDSAFGTITALSAATHEIEMSRISMDGSSRRITVAAADPVLFRQYDQNAAVLSDATASSWDQLHVGDQIYVRGKRSPDGSSVRAGLIVLGGFRTFPGTIQSIDGLTETLAIQDFRSQKLFQVRVFPTAVFRISPFLSDGVARENQPGAKHQWRLHSLEFADLQKGDAVVVLGKVNPSASQVQALAVLTGFGSFNLVPQQPDAQVLWLLDPLNLDIQ